VNRHAKAPSAGSTEGQRKRRGPFLVVLALAICAFLVVGAAPALAAPEASTPILSNASYASVHVEAEANVDGFGRVEIQVSTDQVNWATAYEEVDFSFEPHVIHIQTELTNLKGGTTYFVRVVAVPFGGGGEVTSPGPNPEFTTLPVDPPAVVSIANATNVKYTTAEVTGEVERPTGNANPAFDVRCNFEYVTDAQFLANEANSAPLFEGAGAAPCEPENPVATEGKSPVHATLTSLTVGTTYHLRLSASNAGGTDTKVAAATFPTLTPSAPTVSIDPVTTFTDTTATFKGHITPGGTDPAFDASWEFICTPACPATLSGTPVSASSPSEEIGVEAQATGLEPNTAYQVKLVATNQGGSNHAETPLHTTAVGPGAETIPAFALGNGTEALLGGQVNPKKQVSQYWFEYGTTTAYGSKTPELDAGSGNQPLFETEGIAGLAPGTTYHFRLAAKNATGTTHGEDLSFETASPITFPSDCSNSKLRTETNSAALPECRAYEMASDPDKNGGNASAAVATTAEGNRVGYYASTAFAQSPSTTGINSYMAERGPAGWSTRSMQPPVGTANMSLIGVYNFADFSSDLSKSLVLTRSGAAEPNVQNIFVTSIDGSTQRVGEATVTGSAIGDKSYVGRSADASHVVFVSGQRFTSDSIPTMQVWEWVNGSIRLISVLPDGSISDFGDGGAVVGTGVDAGVGRSTGFTGTLYEPTAVSADGRRIFFGNGNNLYAYEEGAATRAVFLSQRADSVGQPPTGVVRFAGAAVDGSRVYMVNVGGQMTDDATPGGGLYRYDLNTDILHFVSSGATGPAGAQFQGVSLISQDGKRAYFTARSQLVPGTGTPGALNLYTADDEDHVKFVATLAGSDTPRGVATPGASHFAFQSSARLTAFDNAGHAEIYLYRVGDGSLSCVSCGPTLHTPTGDAAMQMLVRSHAISDDGEHVFFQTSDALVAADVNGLSDVYEYRDGNVALISTGTSKYDSGIQVATPDGKDVFFTTRDSLVGQDIDGGSTDVYDARVEGGFPAPVPPSPCEGENCQGKAAAPPAFVGPATASNNGKGNAHGRKQNACKRKTKKQRARCGSKQKKHQAKKHHTKKASKSGRGK
jgi:hypothetical protein